MSFDEPALSEEAIPVDAGRRPAGGGRQKDLTQGPVARTLFLFALPSLGVNILQSINNSVNAVWIGRFLGEAALAATANAGMVMFLMFSALFGFSMATTILIGQYTGRRDPESVKRTLGSSLGIFLLGGIVTAVLGWLFAPQLLNLLGTPAGAYDLALTYLRVIFLSVPTSFVMILLSSSLRGVGDAITPMWTAILNVVLDIILNPVFILGWGPVPAMGIAGSALATLIAGLVSVAALIWQIYHKDAALALRRSELVYLKPDLRFIGPILKMGLPMGLSMIIMSASALVMVALINREGVDTIAAYGIMNQLWSYVQMPAVAVGGAVSAMAAQNIGAGRWDRINKVALSGSLINVAMTAMLILVITVAARPIFELFLASDSSAIPIAIHIHHMVSWTFMLMGVSMVLTFLVRANGAVIAPLAILVVAAVLVRFSIGFGLYDRFGADAIWWAFIATSLSSFVMTVAYYLHGSWRKLSALKRTA